MITKWYKEGLLLNALARSGIGTGEFKYTDTRGNKGSIYPKSDGSTFTPLVSVAGNYLTSITNWGTYFSNGTKEPTETDYCPDGNLITGLSVTPTKTYGTDETGYFLKVIFTITNGTATDVTISEVGTIVKQQQQYADQYVLADRTLLDAPVIIPAGGFGKVEYTIRMNYPTA